jgi:hypothetical protein
MSGEQLVDVRYRGLPLGTSLTLRDFGPETAYLEVDQPMPVGSVVDVTNDGGQTFSARVVHVREKTDSAPQSGMRIAVADAGDAARSWWAERVTQADPPSVKAPAAPAPESAAVALAEAVPEAIPTEVTDNAKRTQVMSAIDLSQIEAMAGPEVTEEFRKREQEAAAVGVTETAPPEPEPDDDDDKKKKKRGRRRKKR